LSRFLLLLLLIGCTSPRRGLPIAGPLELTAAEERGQRVFFKKCHSCHPFGEGGLGPAINDRPLPPLLIQAQVRAGLGAMPAFDREEIPPDDLDALAEYLVTLRRHP
jgi:mono/diheme cytochrome c family protein